MKIFNLSIIFIVICCTLYSCQTEQGKVKEITNKKNIQPKSITKAQAIQLAQSFVINQGYTSEPTNIKLENAVFEPGEYASDIQKLLASRDSLLQLPAYGARQYGDLKKWAVGFELTNYVNNIGRGVSMDSLGGNVRLDPSELRLDWIDEWQPN